jgi:hypothetical protein
MTSYSKVYRALVEKRQISRFFSGTVDSVLFQIAIASSDALITKLASSGKAKKGEGKEGTDTKNEVWEIGEGRMLLLRR